MGQIVTFFVCFNLFFLTSVTALAACSDDSPSCRRVKSNDGVVKIIAGSRGGTYTQMTSEMMSLLPKYSKSSQVRVVPMVGKGSWQNIQDLLYLKGVDIAMVQNDVLEAYARDEEASVRNKVRYIAKLHNEEIHILARKHISSAEDLRGKKVSFGSLGSGTAMTAKTVFNLIGVSVSVVNKNLDESIKALKSGDIEAFVYVSGKPVDALRNQISAGDPVHFLPLNTPKLFNSYTKTTLTSTDYPNLIASNSSVPSITVEAVLAVFNFGSKNVRHKNIVRFSRSLVSALGELKQGNYHPKWKTIDICSNVIGWQRHRSVVPLCGGQSVAPADSILRRQLVKIFMGNNISKSAAERLVKSMSDAEVASEINDLLQTNP